MTTFKLSKPKEPHATNPCNKWIPCQTKIRQTNTAFEEYVNDLKSESFSSQNTLTTIACGVPHAVTESLIEEFCERGVSIVVIDFCDLSYEQCRKLVLNIRQGIFNYSVHKNNRLPYSLAVALDLRGPQIMTGTIHNADEQSIELLTNDYIYITNDIEFKDKCTVNRIYVNSDSILKLQTNDQIYLDFGKIELVVEKVEPEEVYCLIKRGDHLGSQKVVHIPGIPIGMTQLTEQDENDVRTGIQLKVDIIMIPGVRNAKFFDRVRNFLNQEKGTDIDLYAKIDNSVGLENIDDILPNVDGVFLDRPNLSMEVGYDKIFLAQKIILSKCNIVGKPTIARGGFFNSMEYNMVPLSSEVSDIITAVLDGTDCIYLDVTDRSAHKVHCVQYASSICRQADLALNDKKSFPDKGGQTKPKVDPAHAISMGCVDVSIKCNAAAIIVITTSGLSAKIIARYRPRCPILAIVRHGKSSRKISVWRNLIAINYLCPEETTWSKDVMNRTQFAINFGMQKGILNQGDLILRMSCIRQNAGFTNAMSLFYVGSGDLIET